MQNRLDGFDKEENNIKDAIRFPNHLNYHVHSIQTNYINQEKIESEHSSNDKEKEKTRSKNKRKSKHVALNEESKNSSICSEKLNKESNNKVINKKEKIETGTEEKINKKNSDVSGGVTDATKTNNQCKSPFNNTPEYEDEYSIKDAE